MTEHSPEVSYYLAKARKAIRAASAEIHKREAPRPIKRPEPQPEPETDTEEPA